MLYFSSQWLRSCSQSAVSHGAGRKKMTRLRICQRAVIILGCVLRAPTDCLAIRHLNKSKYKEYAFIFVINPDVFISVIWYSVAELFVRKNTRYRRVSFGSFDFILLRRSELKFFKVLDKLLSSRWVWSQLNIPEEVCKSLTSFCYLVNRGTLPLQVSKMVGKLLIKCRWAN